MSTTWASLLGSIRYELDDSATPYAWSDERLLVWTSDALADYSMYNPLEKIEDLSLEVASASYALPSDYLVDLNVQAPSGTPLHKRRTRPGVLFKTRSTATAYEVRGNTLTLNAEADEVYLVYNAIHAGPSTAADTGFAFTFPDRDAELIRLYVCAKAYSRMRSQQSSLDRFKLGSGTREDNPMEPEVEDLMLEYEKKINHRYGGGVKSLILS